MKKILIICDLFPPAFGPRMGYLCKYIRQQDWAPTILTEAVNEKTFSFLKQGNKVTYVNFYTAKHPFIRKIQWLLTFILDLCFGYKDIRMYKKAQTLIQKETFDLILCSSYRTFPLPTAQRIARKYQLPLIIDLRDIIEQYTHNEFISHTPFSFFKIDNLIISVFKKRSLHKRNKALQQANCVTTISPWHVNILKQYNPHVKLIYNGFDPELFYPERHKTQQFIITYTGRILSTAMRNPELLFQALSILAKKHAWTEKECRVHWYIDPVSQEIITKEANKYGVLSFMDFKGYVPASDIPNILNKSSVLLLLTNLSKGTGPKGIMTTKFFEALAVEKPILCVRSDESCLAQTIERTRSGLAATNVHEVCHFLNMYYKEWKDKGYTTLSVKQEELKKFSRKEQAKQFINLFNRLLNEKSKH